jgi:hypothetical protein
MMERILWIVPLIVIGIIIDACGYYPFQMSPVDSTRIILDGLVTVVLTVTAIFVVRYWRETQKMKEEMTEQNKIAEKNIFYQKLPVIDFRHKGGLIFIKNKGSGPAINVTLIKTPLPDNKQKAAVSQPQKRTNEPIDRYYSVIGSEEERFFVEQGYHGMRIKITALFSDIFNRRFHWEFEGEPDDLKLIKFPIDDKQYISNKIISKECHSHKR